MYDILRTLYGVIHHYPQPCSPRFQIPNEFIQIIIIKNIPTCSKTTFSNFWNFFVINCGDTNFCFTNEYLYSDIFTVIYLVENKSKHEIFYNCTYYWRKKQRANWVNHIAIFAIDTVKSLNTGHSRSLKLVPLFRGAR